MLIQEEFDVYRYEGEVGIEVEMEGNNLPRRVNIDWELKRDGSLRGDAIEYITRTPLHRENVEKALKTLYSKFKTASLEPSDRCGVHIHLNCQTLTVEQTINLIVLYIILEELLVDFCGEERKGNLFCLRVSDAEGILFILRTICKNNSFKYISNRQRYYRYAAINITALRKFGSLEFRSMYTPLDYRIILDWIRILLRMKDYSLEFKSSKEFVQQINELGGYQFVVNIFGDILPTLTKNLNMFNKKETLSDMILQGARTVQDIAYINKKKINKKKNLLNIKDSYRDVSLHVPLRVSRWQIAEDIVISTTDPT